MADRDRFLSQCDQCKPGTVGWLISQLVEKSSVEYGQGLQSIVIETPLHFGMGNSHPNLDIFSIGDGEDGSLCIELAVATHPANSENHEVLK